MTTTRTIAKIAAASLIAFAALAAAPAQAEDSGKKEYALTNQGAAGSVLAFSRACKAADEDAGIVCNGETANTYPSAPANFAFGF